MLKIYTFGLIYMGITSTLATQMAPDLEAFFHKPYEQRKKGSKMPVENSGQLHTRENIQRDEENEKLIKEEILKIQKDKQQIIQAYPAERAADAQKDHYVLKYNAIIKELEKLETQKSQNKEQIRKKINEINEKYFPEDATFM